MSKNEDYLLVKRDELSSLSTEIMQLKVTLPQVLNREQLATSSRLQQLEQEVKRLRQENTDARTNAEHWQTKHQSVMEDCQREKQKNVNLHREVESLMSEISQQADYCNELGSCCGTILWRVSRSEASVQSMLAGEKVDNFFILSSSTLSSFISAYGSEWPMDKTSELEFVMSICGTVTNITASAIGRDALLNNKHGDKIVNVYIKCLRDAPPNKSAKLKSLLLMMLYNLTINQKGVPLLSSKPGLIATLVWLLQEENDMENSTLTLRLLQAVISDDNNRSVILQLQEQLTPDLLAKLTCHKSKEIRELMQELISDMNPVE